MGYKLGKSSRAELKGVHPDMIKVVERAIEITEQDFTVFDGIRTAADQRALYKRGASHDQALCNDCCGVLGYVRGVVLRREVERLQQRCVA